MKAEELAVGKKLAEDALKWHRSTMPFPDEYTEEDIPKLVKWLKQHAFPELARNDESIPSDTPANPKFRHQPARKK